MSHLQGFFFFFQCLLAEREGFEPPVPLSTAVFKTAAIDHSAISPVYCYAFSQTRCKGRDYFLRCKLLMCFFT